MQTEKESVFLLTSTPYRDSDLIINLLSPNYGLLSATIYGGKKLGKKTSFPYHLGDYIDIDFQIQERNDFIKIYSVQKRALTDIEHFSYLQFLFHCYFLETIRWIAKPRNPARELIELLKIYIELTWKNQYQLNQIVFLVDMLIKNIGFGINYNQCFSCEKPTWKTVKNNTIFRKEQYYLDSVESGFICHSCAPNKINPISPAMIKILWLLDIKPESFFKPIPELSLLQLLRIQHLHLTQNLDIKIKSFDLLFDELTKRIQ